MKKILLGAAAGVGLVMTTIYCMVVSYKVGIRTAQEEIKYENELLEKIKKLEETINSVKTAK